MTARFAAPDAAALPLHLIAQDDLNGWLADQPPAIAAWVVGNGFTAARGQALRVPGPDGAPALALGGYGTAKSRARKRFALAAVAETLGQGTYALVSDLPPKSLRSRLWAGFWRPIGSPAIAPPRARRRNWWPRRP